MERSAHPAPRAEARLTDLGLVLPAPLPRAPGTVAARPVRVHLDRAIVAPVGALDPDLRHSTTGAGLALLALLRREIGSLDRVTAWLRIEAQVVIEPGAPVSEALLEPVSDLVLTLFGPAIGAHARGITGVASLPGDWLVAISAEVAIGPEEHGRTLVGVLAETIPVTAEEPSAA